MPDLDESVCYSPDGIDFWLRHWRELESAVQGGSASPSDSRGGRHGRESLMAIKVDLERAADALPLYWQITAYVFRRQHRSDVYGQRRRTEPAVPEDRREYESPIPSVSYEAALERMALSLGWQPEQERVA